jgi:hypothetical protein
VDGMQALESQVAEFSALREEIAYRSHFQQLLINLNIVASGTVGGIALTRSTNEAVVLLIPAIASALGLLYADHSRSIVYLGKYLAEEFRTPEGDPIFRWESKSSELDAQRPRLFAFKLSLFLVFVVPPIIALTYLLIHIEGFWSSASRSVGWSVGALLTGLMAATLMTTRLKPDLNKKTTKN